MSDKHVHEWYIKPGDIGLSCKCGAYMGMAVLNAELSQLAAAQQTICDEEEAHAKLQARCYEGYPSATDGIFDYVKQQQQTIVEQAEVIKDRKKCARDLDRLLSSACDKWEKMKTRAEAAEAANASLTKRMGVLEGALQKIFEYERSAYGQSPSEMERAIAIALDRIHAICCETDAALGADLGKKECKNRTDNCDYPNECETCDSFGADGGGE